jgi:hypothetical protein
MKEVNILSDKKRATVVDNELQAYVVNGAQKATLYKATKRTDVNYISFPLSPVNVHDRRWSGDRTFDHDNNIFSDYPTIEDLQHFLQVLYDELEVSIIRGMEGPNLLSLQDLYTYDTVSKYIDKIYEELHLSIKHFPNRRESFFTDSLRDKVSSYNTLQLKFVHDCRIPEYRDEESSSN